MTLFYFRHILNGIYPSLYKIINFKDYTAFFFFSPYERERAAAYIMTEDMIARPGMILAIFRVILTNGRLGAIPGERIFCHAIFISTVQNIIFGLIY